jgi:hypothetical protein
MGAELGFQPLQSLQNIAVINGRPSVWGDAFRAMIIGSPDLVDFKEWYENNTAYCVIKRRLASGAIVEFTGSFSLDDAKAAGLLGKQGPWTQYQKRMQQWRALGFAGRDAYADRLRGIWIDAEAQDMPPEKEVNPPGPKEGSLLNRKMASAQQETVIETEQELKNDKFEMLGMALRDCSCIEELEEVGAEIGKAINQKLFNENDIKSLRVSYNRLKHQFETETVDAETGEIA